MSTLSQITTALENDKTAIRQAILSGGGTCPEGHGFGSFANDIATIPVSNIDSLTECLYNCGLVDDETEELTTEDIIAINYNNLYNTLNAYSKFQSGSTIYTIGGNSGSRYSFPCTKVDETYKSTKISYFPLIWYPSAKSDDGDKERFVVCDIVKKRHAYLDGFWVNSSEGQPVRMTVKYKFCLLHKTNTLITESPTGEIVDISEVKTKSESSYSNYNFYISISTSSDDIDWNSIDEETYKDYILALCILEITSNKYFSSINLNSNFSPSSRKIILDTTYNP